MTINVWTTLAAETATAAPGGRASATLTHIVKFVIFSIPSAAEQEILFSSRGSTAQHGARPRAHSTFARAATTPPPCCHYHQINILTDFRATRQNSRCERNVLKSNGWVISAKGERDGKRDSVYLQWSRFLRSEKSANFFHSRK